MHEELIPVIDKLERAVADRDSATIVSILTELRETFIYSGNEAYERFGKIESEMLIVLFDTINLDEFCRLFIDSNKIYCSDIWKALESIADRVSFDDLWTMKDYYGFPGPLRTPKLYAILVDHPDTEISRELLETVERLSAHESREGVDFSDHEARMSAFRYIRWMPDDKGLSDVVRLLGNRSDSIARGATRKYLLELPWGRIKERRSLSWTEYRNKKEIGPGNRSGSPCRSTRSRSCRDCGFGGPCSPSNRRKPFSEPSRIATMIATRRI